MIESVNGLVARRLGIKVDNPYRHPPQTTPVQAAELIVAKLKLHAE